MWWAEGSDNRAEESDKKRKEKGCVREKERMEQ